MLTIRPLLPTDREKIYIILQQTDMFTPAEIEVAMELVDIYLFNKNQKDYQIYVAVSPQQEILGYICYGPVPATEGTYDVYWIAVAPGHQRLGIGKKLLQFMENEVYGQRGRLIIVETSSVSRYIPTHKFYESNGFFLAGRIKNFYRTGDDRLIYTKYLPEKNKEDIFKNGNMAENPEKERNYT